MVIVIIFVNISSIGRLNIIVANIILINCNIVLINIVNNLIIIICILANIIVIIDIINIVAAGGTTAGIAGDIVAVARSRLSPHLPRPRPRDIVAASKMLCAFDGDANAPTAAAFFRTYLNAVLEALSPAERSDRDAITEFVTPALARIESRPPLGEDIAALVARVRRALV